MGATILRQSTAVDVLIGPFTDSSDMFTPEEALSPSVLLSKNGQALAAKNDVTTPVHDDAGYYNCELDATDTATIGALVLVVEGNSTHLPVRHEYQVIEQATYDSIYTTDAVQLATQASVAAIGASSGGALNFANEGDNVDSALQGVTFVGVETSGTSDTVDADDGNYHQIDDVGNAIDIVYEFSVGAGRSAVAATFKGYLQSSNDTITVQAWNGSGWDTRVVIPGQNTATDVTVDITLLSVHTGTGSDVGKVYLRFVCSGQSNPTLFTNELLVQAVSIGLSTGYDGGFVYFDSGVSNTGTEPFVDGTADNPVSSWESVKAILASVGLAKVDVVGAVTLTSSAEGVVTMRGHRATVALNNQNIGDVEFINFKDVSGVGTTTSARPVFTDCIMNGPTLPPSFIRACELKGTLTFGASGGWDIDHCSSGVAGLTAPIIDFNSTDNNTLGITNWFRGLTLSGLAASDVLTVHGDYNTLTLNGADATVNVAGMYGTLTNNLTGSPTVSIVNAFDKGDIADILADTALWESAHAEPTGAPAANESPLNKLAYLFMMARNRIDVTASAKTFYDDAGNAEFSKSLTDNGTTYTEAEAS